MSKTFVSHNNILSNLGFDSETVVENISKGKSGLEKFDDASILPEPFCASMISSEVIKSEFNKIGNPSKYTKLEQMLILSLKKVVDATDIQLNEKVGLIISTTKGNIDVLEKQSNFPESRAYLSELGKTIQNFFGFKNEAIVLSNACVSGVLAISVAKSFISEGKYDHVFITS
ncbi:MAG: beta-ketoacyl synthase, partial [Aequorivita vladivostokensis]|nr:beta-ketoacyl synthase [Aequorivita vladivostokensis]